MWHHLKLTFESHPLCVCVRVSGKSRRNMVARTIFLRLWIVEHHFQTIEVAMKKYI